MSEFRAVSDLTPHFLSREECQGIYTRLASSVATGDIALDIASSWTGTTRFSSNVIRTSRDVYANDVMVTRSINGALRQVAGNQTDDVSLRAMARRLERFLLAQPETTDDRLGLRLQKPSPRDTTVHAARNIHEHAVRELAATSILANTPEPLAQPTLFFDTTYAMDPGKRAAAIEPLVAPAKQQGMLAAGDIEVVARGRALNSTTGLGVFYPATYASYSVTVRTADGGASGWAGVNWNDWDRVDAARLSAIALDKCARSRNPVRVEPGRLTVILEPQAVWDLCAPCISGLQGFGSILQKHVVDSRITVSQDPMDPDCGFLPFADNPRELDWWGGSMYPATWISQGVLVAIPYTRAAAIRGLHQNTGLPNGGSNRMSGGTATIDDLITASQRAIVVTRFSDVTILDPLTLLTSGYTRDGTWLVERGKITSPVKNFKFIEYPTAVLNRVEALGVPQRVFTGTGSTVAAMVPALMVRDFNFITLTDAI